MHPVSLRYLDARGRTTTAPAFLGDDTLLAWAWRVVRAGALTVELRWLPAVPGSSTAVIRRSIGPARPVVRTAGSAGPWVARPA